MNIREVKTVRCSPGFWDRAGGRADSGRTAGLPPQQLTRELPRRKLAAPRQRGCSHQARNLWMGSRCHAMPSRVTAKSISRDFRNSENLKICRASFMPRYLFRWSTKTVPR